MESTRVACLACERPTPRTGLVQCQGCKLVWYCSEACKSTHYSKHVRVCGTVQLRLDALSADDQFLWHLNAAAVRYLLAPAVIRAGSHLARPYPIPADRVLLIHFDGPVRALVFAPGTSAPAGHLHLLADSLFVRMARLLGRFVELNAFLGLELSSAGGAVAAHPSIRVLLPVESEAAALVARDSANMEGTRTSWLASNKARMAIVSSIDGRLECTRAYMATLDQPR